MSRTSNDIQWPARPLEEIPLPDERDDSPEDDFEHLVIIFGLSALVILGLLVCIPFFVGSF